MISRDRMRLISRRKWLKCYHASSLVSKFERGKKSDVLMASLWALMIFDVMVIVVYVLGNEVSLPLFGGRGNIQH